MGLTDHNGHAFLIDDCIFTRQHWETKLRSRNFKAFSSIRELRAYVEGASFANAIVFLDYEMNDGSHASDNAQLLFTWGFKTVFITTAHHPDAIEPVAGVCGIISKDPPEWLVPHETSSGAEEKPAR